MEFSAVNRRRPSRETPLGPGAKKDGCFRRLVKRQKDKKFEKITDESKTSFNLSRKNKQVFYGL